MIIETELKAYHNSQVYLPEELKDIKVIDAQGPFELLEFDDAPGSASSVNQHVLKALFPNRKLEEGKIYLIKEGNTIYYS